MSLGQRFGNFLLIAGAVSLFIFYASLYSESKEIHFEALLIGVASLILGWRMRFAKRPAPPPGQGGSETRPDKAPPAKPAAPSQKRGGLLSGLFKPGRQGGSETRPDKAPPKAAPPPPPKKGLAGLFGAKPKPPAPAQGKPPQRK